MSRLVSVPIALLVCVACTDNAPVAPVPPPPPPPPGNHAPVAKISGPTSGREGQILSFDARGSRDPDGDSLHFTWLLGDGRIYTDSIQVLNSVGWEYPDNGVYTASLIARDGRGASDTATLTITIVNVPPVIARITPPAQQALGAVGSTRLEYSDSGTADQHSFTIDWGDGTSNSRSTADSTPWADTSLHVYAKTGRYFVRVILRDDDGGADTATATSPIIVFDASTHQTVAGYEVFDLGTLGGNSARPLGFNDYGKIVGGSLTADGSTHAFLWENDVMRDLGTLGHANSEAARINNHELIAGAVWTGENGDRTPNMRATTWVNGVGQVLDSVYSEPAYNWTGARGPMIAVTLNESGDIVWSEAGHEDPWSWLWHDGQWQRLGAIEHRLEHTWPAAMNERTQIVGTSDALHTGESPYPTHHASVWQDDTVRDLGMLAVQRCPDYPDKNCGWSSASSINEHGQVVGFSTDAAGSVHAVLWDNGTTRDLWTVSSDVYLGGRVLINDAGQVAGFANGVAYFWHDGSLRPLGSLGGAWTNVAGINESGAVVGTSLTAGGEQHAFIWTEAGGMVDLGTGPAGFNAAWVIGISYYGDIVGFTTPCNRNPGQPCYYWEQVRAILWRKR